MVGKVIKLKEVRGDMGYGGDIPMDLGIYRQMGWLEIEGDKLLL
jgi:hypothetical protein